MIQTYSARVSRNKKAAKPRKTISYRRQELDGKKEMRKCAMRRVSMQFR